MRSYRVTIRNRRVAEMIRRVYVAANEKDARRQALANYPYRYGWRVTHIERWT